MMEVCPEYDNLLIIHFIIIESNDRLWKKFSLVMNFLYITKLGILWKMLTCNGKWKLIFYYLIVSICFGIFIRQAIHCIERFVRQETNVHHDLERLIQGNFKNLKNILTQSYFSVLQLLNFQLWLFVQILM